MSVLRSGAAGAVLAAALLLGTSVATAKDFEPGDLRVCGQKRCVAVKDRSVLRVFSSFYYGDGRVATARAPRVGAPAFALRLGGSVAGIAGSARLDRVLVYGLNCGRFRHGTWYRLPARAAQELRRLTVQLRPLRVSRVVPRSC